MRVTATDVWFRRVIAGTVIARASHGVIIQADDGQRYYATYGNDLFAPPELTIMSGITIPTNVQIGERYCSPRNN